MNHETCMRKQLRGKLESLALQIFNPGSEHSARKHENLKHSQVPTIVNAGAGGKQAVIAKKICEKCAGRRTYF